ncbi:alpha-L-fucosidase [Sphingobacterium sp. E70]|uniref:alpha-L-fucosidase n=1 Tax=Sphingobacterium sp. E70 TaxID=2853439 RepID=UPI00211C1FC2|nr:alpha-L-fucosidase [Sphingobacterium sp. E70]ULT27323.1 alpha-L-fucosidase [Sphingobacterium sp. E70]
MKKLTGLALALIALLFNSKVQAQVNYLNQSKADFDKHMQWFRDAKYGMFIHFGLYSQLGGDYKESQLKAMPNGFRQGQIFPRKNMPS